MPLRPGDFRLSRIGALWLHSAWSAPAVHRRKSANLSDSRTSDRSEKDCRGSENLERPDDRFAGRHTPIWIPVRWWVHAALWHPHTRHWDGNYSSGQHRSGVGATPALLVYRSRSELQPAYGQLR